MDQYFTKLITSPGNGSPVSNGDVKEPSIYSFEGDEMTG